MLNKESTDVIIDPFELATLQVMFQLTAAKAFNAKEIEAAIGLLGELKMEHYQVERKTEYLKNQVNYDKKTGLLKPDERYLTEIMSIASRTLHNMTVPDYPVAFARLDIDNFSSFNNEYGHAVGDEVLVKLARILKRRTRPTDYVIRFGGEEIDIIFSATTIDGAKAVLDGIYKEVRAMEVPYRKELLTVTVSGGVTGRSFPLDEIRIINDNETRDLYRLIQREADDALYASKAWGKDQYNIYSTAKQKTYQDLRNKYSKRF